MIKNIKLTELHKNVKEVILNDVLKDNDTLLVTLDKGPVDGQGEIVIMSKKEYDNLNK